MAHIIVDGGEPIHLAYAPVNFEEQYDFDLKDDHVKSLRLWGGIFGLFIFMGCLTWYILKSTRDAA